MNHLLRWFCSGAFSRCKVGKCSAVFCNQNHQSLSMLVACGHLWWKVFECGKEWSLPTFDLCGSAIKRPIWCCHSWNWSLPRAVSHQISNFNFQVASLLTSNLITAISAVSSTITAARGRDTLIVGTVKSWTGGICRCRQWTGCNYQRAGDKVFVYDLRF